MPEPRSPAPDKRMKERIYFPARDIAKAAGVTEVTIRNRPFLDVKQYGIFSTRAPVRPNPIGISVVTLRSVRGGRLYVQDLDVVEGTPLLDIKPYVPEFDSRPAEQVGWYATRLERLPRVRADGRFTRETLTKTQ